jgi:hypothetical protein
MALTHKSPKPAGQSYDQTLLHALLYLDAIGVRLRTVCAS